MIEHNNVRLNELLINSEISEKWKYEIKSIFRVLNDKRKIEILENFDFFIVKIIDIEEEHKERQKILVEESMDRMDKILQKYI